MNKKQLIFTELIYIRLMEELSAIDDGIEEMTSNEPPNRIVVDGWEYMRRDMLEIPILKSTSDKLVRRLVEHVENGRWYYEWEIISYPEDLWKIMMEKRIEDLKIWDELENDPNCKITYVKGKPIVEYIEENWN